MMNCPICDGVFIGVQGYVIGDCPHGVAEIFCKYEHQRAEARYWARVFKARYESALKAWHRAYDLEIEARRRAESAEESEEHLIATVNDEALGYMETIAELTKRAEAAEVQVDWLTAILGNLTRLESEVRGRALHAEKFAAETTALAANKNIELGRLYKDIARLRRELDIARKALEEIAHGCPSSVNWVEQIQTLMAIAAKALREMDGE